MLLKSQTDRNGNSSGTFRFNADCGIQSKNIKDIELRWIWNPDYVALIEKTEGGEWSLQRLLTPETEVYAKTKSDSSTASYLFGSPLLRRIESLGPMSTARESDDSLYEYQLLPDHPMHSMNPAWNSMTFRFDRNSEESRLEEIKFYESAGGPDSKAVIEWVLTLEYPNDALFPFELVAKGAIVSGRIPEVKDKDLWSRVLIDTDEDARLEPSECYLQYYGLPEPKLVQEDQTADQTKMP